MCKCLLIPGPVLQVLAHFVVVATHFLVVFFCQHYLEIVHDHSVLFKVAILFLLISSV